MSDPATHAESRMLIDGELVPARDDRSYENLNPATEEVLGLVADAAPEDMDRAIGAARRAVRRGADKDARRGILRCGAVQRQGQGSARAQVGTGMRSLL